MRISFHQPVFIPWGGFFCRLLVSDAMVLLDDTWLAQGFTFVNRNRLKGPDGELWTTVPIRNVKGKRQKIRNLEIHEKQYWAMKWMKTLFHAYAKSIYFKQLGDQLNTIVREDDSRFMDLIFPLLEFLKSELQLTAPFVFQSDIGIKSGGTDLLLDIAQNLKADEVVLPYFSQNSVQWERLEKQGIKVRFLYFYSPVYPQFWGDFLKNLSVLDLLFCMGRESRRVLDNGYKLISLSAG